jgi:hypothetical protein
MPSTRNKTQIHTASEKSVRVSVDERLSGGETGSSRVAVSVVNSARAVDARGVGGLVEDGGGLVLAVASSGQGRELVEEGGAVGEQVGGWKSVREHTAGASAVDVGAVGAGHAAGGGAAVVGHGAESGGDGGGRRCLEDVGVARAARTGSVGCAGGQAAAVADRIANSSATSASAVALDDRTLGEPGNSSLDLGSLLRVDINGDGLGSVRQKVSGKLGGTLLSVHEGASGGNAVGASLRKLVQLGELDFYLNGLTGQNGLEDVIVKTGGGHTLVQTSERSAGSCETIRELIKKNRRATYCSRKRSTCR